MERKVAEEPPVVLPPLNPDDRLEVDGHYAIQDTSDWLDRIWGGESYGAPRVFDIFTLLAITLAFALLLAFLRLIEPLLMEALETVAIIIGLFVVGIGLFQMVLWGGKKPRLASLVAGPFLWLAFFIPPLVFNRNGVQHFADPTIVATVFFSKVLGIVPGYLGGAMVGGVFLLADFFRTKYLRKPKQTIADNDDEIFL